MSCICDIVYAVGVPPWTSSRQGWRFATMPEANGNANNWSAPRPSQALHPTNATSAGATRVAACRPDVPSLIRPFRPAARGRYLR